MRRLGLRGSLRLKDIRTEVSRREQATACVELHSCGKPPPSSKSLYRLIL
jgi:hypothetical protein